ncbi:hypothetical protein RhiirA4_457014 [Rhizophagus irregularis]|uniref:Uncharacterized protein n=1 Tax=Rhizophagus irregularis TaxID=588596 RepID=A0A2I1G8X2_9GLOM|nr:hypothetical protein RhiirA4_457014 [Rhizophagus irregularis]
MDDDDIIGVDECDGNSDCTINIDIDYDKNINSFSNKRRTYSGPIAVMTDSTKLKPELHYSPQLGCIIGSSIVVIFKDL